MHVMHGPSVSSSYCTVSISRMKSAVDRPRLDAGRRRAEVSDQGDTGTVDAGDGPHREFGDVTEHFDHAAGAGHDPGDPGQPGMQVHVVGLELGARTVPAPPAACARAGRRNRPW